MDPIDARPTMAVLMTTCGRILYCLADCVPREVRLGRLDPDDLIAASDADTGDLLPLPALIEGRWTS